MKRESPLSAWSAAELDAGKEHWQFMLDDAGRRDLLGALKSAQDPAKTLLDYRRDDFELGAAWPVLSAAFEQAKRGRGVALVRGLPREGLAESEFELLTWAIGLHAGVARPQGKASHYVSAVRDAGTAYRTGTGRGYSTNAELDFHTDSADLVMLTCYNKAASGGMSITTSTPAAYARMQAETPALAEWLLHPVHFSRQGEQAATEAPSYPHPVIDHAGGKLFSKWNWNRVNSAQKLEGVPRIPSEQQAALAAFDALVRHPEFAHTMWLEPGDLQIINSHVTLHSRTNFSDHHDPANKRLLFRLWLTPPDGDLLPDSWRVLYGAVEPATVRGGIIGQNYDARCRKFDQAQAQALCMRLPDT